MELFALNLIIIFIQFLWTRKILFACIHLLKYWWISCGFCINSFHKICSLWIYSFFYLIHFVYIYMELHFFLLHYIFFLIYYIYIWFLIRTYHTLHFSLIDKKLWYVLWNFQILIAFWIWICKKFRIIFYGFWIYS